MTNTLINNNTTFNKTEDTCTSISIKMDGYLTNDITYKTIKVDTGEGISKFVTQKDLDESTILYTDNYTYTVPEAKQWDEPVSSDADSDLKIESLDAIQEDSDYINKIDSIITQLEAHNG